jgi:hypothetical protein
LPPGDKLPGNPSLPATRIGHDHSLPMTQALHPVLSVSAAGPHIHWLGMWPIIRRQLQIVPQLLMQS